MNISFMACLPPENPRYDRVSQIAREYVANKGKNAEETTAMLNQVINEMAISEMKSKHPDIVSKAMEYAKKQVELAFECMKTVYNAPPDYPENEKYSQTIQARSALSLLA